MKLAIIRQRYTPFGGAERFIENALQALRQQGGLEVTVITREWHAITPPRTLGEGLGERALARPQIVICNPFHLGRVWRQWAFSRAACKAVADGNYDLVQSHERLSCCDIFRAGDGVHREWLRQRDRILSPWRRWLTRLSPFHQLGLWQERRMFASPRLKVVIANSEGVKADIMRHYPQTQARIEVIYNGVDLARFHPDLKAEFRQTQREKLGIAPDAPVLLFVGSGFERKGLATAIRALSPRPPGEGSGERVSVAHLVVVGKDRQQRRYQKLALRLGIADRVHFAGPQPDVRPYYGMADLFVFPSLYDPFPNAVLEAMACGLPVIVSNTCGSADFMQGQALDALDVEGWSKAIAAALESGQRAEMADKSRRIAESLSLEHMASRMAALYMSCNNG